MALDDVLVNPKVRRVVRFKLSQQGLQESSRRMTTIGLKGGAGTKPEERKDLSFQARRGAIQDVL